MDLNDTKYFLGEGKYTERDSLIKDTLERVKGKGDHIRKNISHFISKNFDLDRSIKRRSRTASEIIKSGKVTGCADTALIFLVLAREAGIPTRYVETLQEDWINGLLPVRPTEGHIFAEVLLDRNWHTYEPRKGFTPNNQYVLAERVYVPIGRGLDFGELDAFPEGIPADFDYTIFRKK